jgi:tetratricopeptide (TPR) repeat protein
LIAIILFAHAPADAGGLKKKGLGSVPVTVEGCWSDAQIGDLAPSDLEVTTEEGRRVLRKVALRLIGERSLPCAERLLERYVQETERHAPNDGDALASAYLHLGRVRLALDHYESALDAFTHAASLAPSGVNTPISLPYWQARCAYGLGRWREAGRRFGDYFDILDRQRPGKPNRLKFGVEAAMILADPTMINDIEVRIDLVRRALRAVARVEGTGAMTERLIFRLSQLYIERRFHTRVREILDRINFRLTDDGALRQRGLNASPLELDRT